MSEGPINHETSTQRKWSAATHLRLMVNELGRVLGCCNVFELIKLFLNCNLLLQITN